MKILKERLKLAVITLFTAVGLCSCETINLDEMTTINDINQEDQATEYLEVVRKARVKKEKPSLKEDSIDELESTEKAIDNVTDIKGQKQVNIRTPFYLPLIKDKNKKIPFTGNFEKMPIREIIPYFAESLNFNYMLDAAVDGTASLNIRKEMSYQQSWEVFISLLEQNGAYCSYDGNVVAIKPIQKLADEKNLFSQNAPAPPNAQSSVFTLRNAPSKHVAEQLKQFVSDGAKIVEMAKQNAIMVIDKPDVIEKVRSVIRILDHPVSASLSRVALPCHNVQAKTIVTELSRVLPVLGFSVSEGEESDMSGSVHLTSLDRFELVVATAANGEALKELVNWVKILDTRDKGNQERVFVFKVENGKAEELMQVLSVIFFINGKVTTAKSYVDKGKDELNDISSGSIIGADDSTKPPTTIFDTPAKVYADGVNNRLVVRTTSRTYAMMKALLERLDTPQTQVLLQVMVASIDLTDGTEFGVEYNNLSIDGVDNKSLFTDYEEILPAGKGLNYSTKVNDQFLYLRALATKNHLRVLSSPQVAVVNHKVARLEVGRQVAVKTGETTDSSGTGVTNTFDYKDTGIILKITPHISKAGLITLDLSQEISQTIPTPLGQNPDIAKKSIETTMTIRDGKTLVVGGLIENSIQDNEDGLPFLQKLGIFGRLFGYTDYEKTRAELLVLVTGRILTERSRLQELMSRYTESVAELRKLEPGIE